MKKLIFISLILLALLITACRPTSATSRPTTTQESTATLPATVAFTSAPPAVSPTATSVRNTPTPKPTVSPLDIASIVLTELSIDETHAYSPNGFCEWKRIVASSFGDASYKYNNQFFTYVTINCGGQDKPWVLVSKWTEQGLGYPLTSLLGWSIDGRFLYFYDAIIPDGCQPIGGFQQDLRRVDLSNGDIHSFAISWTGGIALSPASTRVIYYDRQTVEVGIFDFVKGEEQRLKFELPTGLESWFAGDFTWSPDGQAALFIVEYGDACFPSGVSLRLVDPRAGKVTTLLERENQTLSILSWAEPDKVLISFDKEQQVLDPNTGRLSAP